MTKITRDIAAKVLDVVDKGLSFGLGEPKLGEMCVEAAVCYALDLPHGDNPGCVSPALRLLKIGLNDSNWSSKAARARGLRRLAVAQLGSAGVLDDKEFVRRVTELIIRKQVPLALRAAASIHKNAEHKAALIAAAAKCEAEGTRESAQEAKTAATSAASANAATAANATSTSAAKAAAYAAANAYANAAYSAAYANAYAAYAATDAAEGAADASRSWSRGSIGDKVLSDFAEDVVQILIAMDAPGCRWLPLTEAT